MHDSATVLHPLQDPSERLRVLVIEDDHAYSRLAHDVLEGHERFQAGTAREGVRQFLNYHPDVTFLDISLPDADGFQVLRQLKQQRPEAYIVMLTASRLAADVRAAQDAGAAGYIVKPFTRGKVLGYLAGYREYQARLADMPAEERQARAAACMHNGDACMLPGITPTPDPDAARRAQLAYWRILFVDPDRDNGLRVQHRLASLGATVDLAAGAGEAQHLLAAQAYGLVFLPTHLPASASHPTITDGALLAAEARRYHPHVALAVMTDEPWQQASLKWRLVTPSAILRRPISSQALLEVVDREFTRWSEDNPDAWTAT